MELMVVVALIAVFAVVAVPSFHHLLSPDVERDVQIRLENLLLAVRQESILGRRPLLVLYNLEKGTFRSAFLDNNGQAETEGEPLLLRRRLPEGIKFTDVITPRDGKVTRGKCFTIVWPTGLMEPTTLHLEDDSGKPYTLMIEPLAGTVRVEEGYLERRRVPS
jgi:hypothetical protein